MVQFLDSLVDFLDCDPNSLVLHGDEDSAAFSDKFVPPVETVQRQVRCSHRLQGQRENMTGSTRPLYAQKQGGARHSRTIF